MNKNFCNSLLICLITAFAGCETDSTFRELPISVNDQVFSLPENASSGTLIGCLAPENHDSLHYFLVYSEQSESFRVDSISGELFVEDETQIDYEKNTQIELELLSYRNGLKANHGKISNITIKILNEKEPHSWTSDIELGENKHAVVNSLYPSTANANPENYMISSWTVNLKPSVCRTYIWFDLSKIPASSTISKATLTLKHPDDGIEDHEQSPFSGSNSFIIRKITSTWDINYITWKHQPTNTINNQTILPASTEPNQNYEADVTGIVADMVGQPSTNYGFVLMLENESYYRRICFASMEHSNKDLRPVLEINYLN